MKQRAKFLILPMVTLILEILPYGAVCNFMRPPMEDGGAARSFRELYSYFNLTPFGYANFSPLLTALATCFVLLLALVYVITNKEKILKTLKSFLILSIVLSLCPLLLGFRFFSIVGALITLTLILEYLLIKFKKTL